MDVVIPIVFPEYRISVETPRTTVDVLPWFEFDNVTIPAQKLKMSELGHAGVLFINGRNGATKYYEYGRYDSANRGLVRRVPVPDASVRGNAIQQDSLVRPLSLISRVAGQGGRIKGCYIEVDGKYEAMLAYAEKQKRNNANPNRQPYHLTSNLCIHLVKAVVAEAGVGTPWMVDPRPNSYIGEFRDVFPDLDFDPSSNVLRIEAETA